ncbi:translocation/assembly module TamB domain-containing protein [Cyanobium sp. HWJ4-Hawea]|uniref:translocation/assembly module TamB domain-containing protein n=1 Tax=Cyanobium sp. HWJ4-Hawea TaxID=2823713 RepID=UPI0020CC913E|nr:translocation/assembly module TamB domain-containing protein [Cyanobium sp. HWJ4-Hawea]MCP9809314.1 translocation/assembly module TamB domain-containing protein [Cyanobium sp. HWJ4-Hawea]
MPEQGFQPSRRPSALALRVTALVAVVAGGSLWTSHWLVDQALRQFFARWNPVLESQVARVMGHPFSLGAYQGLGWGGVRVGPTRLGPGPADQSQLSSTGGSVSLDLGASLISSTPVVQIGLEGVRAELRPNRQGQYWVLGPPAVGQKAPRLDLRFRLRDAAEVRIGKGKQPLLLTGRFAIQPHLHQLDLKATVRPSSPAGRGPINPAGSLQIGLGGNWGDRRWYGHLGSKFLDLGALAPALGLPVQLKGSVAGLLKWGWQHQQPSCGGKLLARDLAWHQAAPAGPLRISRLELRCQGNSFALKPLLWQWGKLQGNFQGRGHWSGRGPRGSVVFDRLLLQRQGSWLKGKATLGPFAKGLPPLKAQANWQLRPHDLQQGTAQQSWLGRQPIQGNLQLGLARNQSQLEVQARQATNPLVGPWQAALAWQNSLLRLQHFRSSYLQASGRLPVALGPRGGLGSGELQLDLALAPMPLARLGGLVGAPLQGVVSGQGQLVGRLGAITPNLQLQLDQPGAGPLGSREAWAGSWLGNAAGGGRLELRPQTPGSPGLLTADFNRSWVPIQLRLQRQGGSLVLQGTPRLYRWQAQNLPLDGVQLALGPSRRLQPLSGGLSGQGDLTLQPLGFGVRAALDRPVFLGVWARSATVEGSYRNRQFSAKGSLLPLGGGQLDFDWGGRWQGLFRANFQARQLSDKFLRQLVAAAPQWRGAGLARQGKAQDLGLLAIDSLGQSLQQQLAALLAAQEHLAAARADRQANSTSLEKIERLRALVDADLSLGGSSIAAAKLGLTVKAHLWQADNDQDRALGLEPVQITLQGPLFSGDGSFSVANLPLSLLALLTPVPQQLRGSLLAQGRFRLGGKRPQFSLDLGLSGAALQDTALELKRGRIALETDNLVLDLALQGAGAQNSLELAGKVPLDAQAQGLELRLASRDDGLRFLTRLAEPAVDWQRGRADLQLLVRGSVADPIANGFLRVRDAELGFIGQKLASVQLLALFDFQQVVVQELSAKVGAAGRIEGKGILGLLKPLPNSNPGNSNPGIPNPAKRGLVIGIKAVPFSLPRIKALANGELQIDGGLTSMQMAGDLAISKGSINVAPGEMVPAGGGRPSSSVNELLEQRWNFQKPLVLLGPELESASSASVREAMPRFSALGFNNLRLKLGPDLMVGVPNVASFGTAGSLRLNGRLDPSLSLSGVVRLQKGRLSLFTTSFSLDQANPNVAVFTPSMGLIPYIDIALQTRISDSLNLPGNSLGTPLGPSLENYSNQGSLSSLNQLNLVKVYLSVSGPADQLARNLKLRSSPPLPEDRLLALIGGNTLAGLAAGQAGAALATALGQTLLSPVLGGLSDALGQRVSFALYPIFVNTYVNGTTSQRSGQVPPQLVLGSEIGLDITQRFNTSILAAPNRSDVPPQLNLNYRASDLINLQGTVDSQGAVGGQLQLFLRF